MSISQQTQTLLATLQGKHTPTFPLFLANQLQKIPFDFSDKSLLVLRQFFGHLANKGFDTSKVLAQAGGDNFLLSIAVYLGEYLGKITGENVIWYDYDQALEEIKQQNLQHQTNFQLQPQFGNSFIAKIGEVYCQPLVVVSELLLGNDILQTFFDEMQASIFVKEQVHLLDEPNYVASQYLAKLKTGKLLDKTIGFFDELQAVEFDYSHKSLEKIDEVLQNIKQKYQLNAGQYAEFIKNPSCQQFCYLLGFYIGMTASRLSDIIVKWVDFAEMRAIMGEDFENCLEHRFVLIMENHYRTPMLVITNHLFDIAPNFPTSAVAFAKILHEQNASVLNVFDANGSADIAGLPKLWQQSVTPAVKLLHASLLKVFQQKMVLPNLLYLKKDMTTGRYQPAIQSINNFDSYQAVDNLYEDLALYQQSSPIVLGCYPMIANLPTGRQKALTLEWRCTNPQLSLQAILPYREATKEQGFAVLPLISNQENLSEDAKILLNAVFQQLATQNFGDQALKNYLLPNLDGFSETPFEKAKRQLPMVDNISIPLLPLAQNMQAVGVQIDTPAFDFGQYGWQRFDLPKYVLEMPDQKRDYLQVLAPSRLVNDELFSQVHAMSDLYRFGKVVWGVVVTADNALYQPISGNNLVDVDNFLTAEIIYDPAGKTSIDQLAILAKKIATLKNTNVNVLPKNQAFLAMHLQDERSRLFGHTVIANQTTKILLSSTWVWRRHLPDAMLSGIVPIIINPKTDSPHAGRVMILPSRFWQLNQGSQNFYQYWLNRSIKKFGQNYDIASWLDEQSKAGAWYDTPVFANRQNQIFPKFKQQKNLTNQTPSQINLQNSANPSTMSMPTSHGNHEVLTGNNTQNFANMTTPTPMQPMANSQSAVSANRQNQPNIPQPTGTKPNAAQMAELQRQLLADQARLQSQLSTTDSEKERKLYMIVGVLAVLVILAMIMASFMGK